MRRRVVVTGIGAVSPLGNTAKELIEGFKEGRCGISEIEGMDMTNHKAKLAGQAKAFKAEDHFDAKEARRMDRVTQLGIVASREAVKDSGILDVQVDKTRCGVIVSSGIGGLSTIEKNHTDGMNKGFHRISPFFIPMAITNITAGSVAIEFGFKGTCQCVVTACASATDSIGIAFHKIRDGYEDVMLAGGSEASITPLGIGGFSAMKALSFEEDVTRASIPFDKDRNGFVMGEGAGVLVLEELEHAKKRGAKIYAEVIGYGSSCDAFHITAPDSEAEGAIACLNRALEDARLSPDCIDYINAHGTSTPLNDACETKAVKAVFKEHAYKLMMSSTKSMTGHLLGAAGAVEGIACIMAVHEDFVPATIHYQNRDEDCDLDIVPNQGRRAKVDYALSNSLGFGGHNATLVFKKYREEQ